MQDAPYRLIQLGGRKGTAIRGYAKVDLADFERLDQFNWNLLSAGYAKRDAGGRKNKRVVLMHRDLMGLERGDPREVDHINGDKLDNRRFNLRVVTRAQNSQNLPAYRGTSSSHRGVVWCKTHQRWIAGVKVNGKKWTRYCRTEAEAAAAAEELRREHMPYSVRQ